MLENLVHKEGWIKSLEFKEGEKHYRVVGTSSGTNAMYRYQNVWDAIDTIKDEGSGIRTEYTRRELSERFKQVELLTKENEKKGNRVRKGKVPKQ